MPEATILPKPTSSAEFYRIIRERIDYEENLLNQRVIWLIFSQFDKRICLSIESLQGASTAIN